MDLGGEHKLIVTELKASDYIGQCSSSMRRPVVLVYDGMEKPYLNRVALSARRLVSIVALYLDISYL
jgi:hypothetical protein